MVKIDSSDDFFPSIGAEKLAKEKGHILLMEFEHWSRLGENARIFAFLPDAYLYGVKNPSIKTFNFILFLGALVFFLYRFKNHFLFPFAILLSFILSITPFYLYEVYLNENTFSLMGVLFLIILGINSSILERESSWKNALLYAVLSGLTLGFFNEIRGELKVVLGVTILLYLLTKNLNLGGKFIGIIAVYTSFSLAVSATRMYFDYKWEEAKEYISNHEGYVYNGGRIPSHKFWHPMFCGLGDFGDDKDYVWDDKVAYRYSIPYLEQKLNRKVHYSDRYHLDEYYDSDSIYYVKFDEIEEYEQIMKEKVLGDIKEDKLWYINILFQRAIQAMKVTSPIPFLGFLIIPLLFLVIYYKKRTWLTILVSSMPLSLNAILIYSKSGSTLHGMFGVICLTMTLLIILELIIARKRL